MTPEQLEQLFTPFERLGAEHGTAAGTGLGLVVTKGLVEAMGGQISVASEVGGGTAFTIELPLTDARGAVPAEGRRPPSPAAIGGVLCSDDTPANPRRVATGLAARRARPPLPAATD